MQCYGYLNPTLTLLDLYERRPPDPQLFKNGYNSQRVSMGEMGKRARFSGVNSENGGPIVLTLPLE